MKKVLLTALVAFGLVASFSGCQKKEAPVAQEANKTDANKTEANTTEANKTDANKTEANATKK